MCKEVKQSKLDTKSIYTWIDFNQSATERELSLRGYNATACMMAHYSKTLEEHNVYCNKITINKLNLSASQSWKNILTFSFETTITKNNSDRDKIVPNHRVSLSGQWSRKITLTHLHANISICWSYHKSKHFRRGNKHNAGVAFSYTKST